MKSYAYQPPPDDAPRPGGADPSGQSHSNGPPDHEPYPGASRQGGIPPREPPPTGARSSSFDAGDVPDADRSLPVTSWSSRATSDERPLAPRPFGASSYDDPPAGGPPPGGPPPSRPSIGPSYTPGSHRFGGSKFLWAMVIAVVMGTLLGGVVLGALALRVSGFWARTPSTPSPSSAPALTLDPQWGRPGMLVLVTGSGWRPAETVTLRLAPPGELPTEPLTVGRETVQFDGTFSTGFSVPVVSPWSEFTEVRVLAQGSESGGNVSMIFDMRPRGPTMPTLTPTVTPTFEAVSGSPTPTSEPSITPTPPEPTATVPIVPTPTPTPSGWHGEYYNTPLFLGRPALVRLDEKLDFDWGRGSPAPNILTDGFSVRWTRTLAFEAGTYRFYATADDGVRVWLNDELIIDEWHGARAVTYTADRTLQAGDHHFVVEYYEGWGDANIRFWWDGPGDFPQWRGEYYANAELSGEPVVTRNDPALNFNWGTGSPASGVPADRFSARWTQLVAFEAGTYRFRALVDDGVRVFVGGARVIDAWENGRAREVTGDIALTAGNHLVRVEYFEAAGDAVMQLSWERRDTYPDWRGEYWNNRSLSGLPVLVRNDQDIDFTWGTGAPDPSLPADGFSARWTRTVNFSAGTYRFRVLVDDGVRLWVDDQLVIDAWQDGAERELAANVPLTAGPHSLRLEMYEATERARIRLSWEAVQVTFSDWKGEYWTNANLTGEPAVIRNDERIDFNWGRGSPDPRLPVDNFSARWSRTVTLSAGVYRFSARADDGVRILLDGQLLIDEWHTSSGGTVYTAERQLAGGTYPLVVEYYEGGGDARIQASYERLGDPATPTPLPTATPTATATVTPEPTVTPTATPTGAPAVTPSITPGATEAPLATPTVLPTEGPTVTPTAEPVTAPVRINEIMPNPGETDWNEDGLVDAGDAWIELHNSTQQARDISNWIIEVEDDSNPNSNPNNRKFWRYQIPIDTSLAAGGYLVVYSRESGLSLTGRVRLLEGITLQDELGAETSTVLRELPPDQALSLGPDGQWHEGWKPTPGGENVPPTNDMPADLIMSTPAPVPAPAGGGWLERLLRRLIGGGER